MIYLDTHVIIWLYAGRGDLIPLKTAQMIESEDLVISPICELEVQYLFEIGKIKEEARRITSDLAVRIGLSVCTLPFENVISLSLKESWTRDPFDRLITSHARLQNAPLLTKDRSIQKHYEKASWE
ncbi:MAG: PIN domain-containing protein [Deltaproteobacteria bacterium]|nr:PIN domain-containing protein [Deltaproteobacteria bacterium]